jgi:hypothetical protein
MLGRRKESLREFVRAENESLRELIRSQQEEWQALTEETREFNREILLRNEKVYTAVIVEMEEGRKQVQANTKAVLSVLDRLDGSDGVSA